MKKNILSNLKMGASYIWNKPHGILETKRFEKIYSKAKALDDPASLPQPANATPTNEVLVSYEEAVKIMRENSIGHIPQILGTCVAHTIKNAVRFAVKVTKGRDMDLAEGDIYIDRATIGNGIDSGMYPDYAMNRVIDKGISIQDIVPTAKNLTELGNITRDNYPDNELEPFRIRLLSGYTGIACFKNFDALWSMITNEYKTKGVRPFQFTIYSYSGWWGSDLPTATGKIQGSHSLIGVVLPFIYNGKRAFFAIDSAYLTGRIWRVGTGIRIVTEDCWNGLGISARKLEFVPEIEEKLIKTKKDIVVNKSAQYGDKGLSVENIQRALISLGYDIPAITTGVAEYSYYGKQTATSVKKWQLDNWEKFNSLNNYWNYENIAKLNGNNFGGLSVKVIKTML